MLMLIRTNPVTRTAVVVFISEIVQQTENEHRYFHSILVVPQCSFIRAGRTANGKDYISFAPVSQAAASGH